MCNCLLSSRIESEIFMPFTEIDDVLNPTNILNEDCPICLQSLKINLSGTNVCCGGYARKLKCGHSVHVCCQIYKNINLRKCSLCRKELTTTNIYYKICRAIYINKILVVEKN